MSEALFILYVENQAASARFYEQVLEKPPRLNVPGMTEFQLAEGAVLGLMPEDGIRRLLPKLPDPSRANRLPRAELYLYVDHPGQAYDNAIDCGAEVLDALAQRGWGDWVAYCRDLDGHVLAFASKEEPK